ncbi:hypothetical protein BJX65DRAFT_306906 [Aspergillus insuetus]
MGRDRANVCNIGGGPLDCHGLRQLSTAEEEDYEPLYDDGCDCYRPGEPGYDPDDASLEALDRHDPTCTIHYGLHGGAIPERAIQPLVADPNMKPDFSQLFLAATTPPHDPFSNLPAEICTMIMELLPSTDAKSLINANEHFAGTLHPDPGCNVLVSMSLRAKAVDVSIAAMIMTIGLGKAPRTGWDSRIEVGYGSAAKQSWSKSEVK